MLYMHIDHGECDVFHPNVHAGNVPKALAKYNAFTKRFLKSFADLDGIFYTYNITVTKREKETSDYSI